MTPFLHGRHLEGSDIQDLAPRIRQSDVLDCGTANQNPALALWYGLIAGPSWAVLWKDEAIGALGWTYQGAIWSLWADLTPEQSKALMSRAPAAIKGIAKQAALAGVPALTNIVRADNRLTIAWLWATHCFDFSAGEDVCYQDVRYRRFTVKPLGEL